MGEVLWDLFDHSRRLGGALVNFAAHPGRLGHHALLIRAVGAFSVGRPGDRFGRQPCLVALDALYLASALGCALACTWAALIFFRIIGGLAIGASSVIGPMYIDHRV